MIRIPLSVLLLLWGLPLSSATGRLRTFDLISEQMLMNEAQNICRINYTDLVTIYDEEENQELVDILKSVNNSVSGWIGANSCKWSNGDPVTFTKYICPFEEEKCCGAVNTTGGWKCINCNSIQMYFMCYDKDHGQESYKYSLISENKTWLGARDYCRKNHTDLVSIRNKTENEQVIQEAVNGRNSFWIGLQYNNSLDWFDGGLSNYTENTTSNGCFTYLSKENNIKSKDSWFKGNIGYFSALCYKSFIHVSENEMSWEEALDYCDGNFSGLLTIQSENDQIEIERELKRRVHNITGPFWVGLRKSRLFGYWIWINGINVGNWNNWKGGSPPEQLSRYCGAIEKVDGQYKWCDKGCRKKYRVLCEMK